ncbi:ADP-ribosylglycohydrolase family protein [Tautonia rosea]|uniref:ADP-ribosylglycohydrolase family protein n=1 Tax=Tautonia rosea TaxID=2728037 RepID=UPI0014762148|nr:ADP-ribosylglycohydrolase family protein [Tautonia rosea]
MPSLPSRDQFQGCLIGQAVGDALGAPYEGMPPEFIAQAGPAETIVTFPPHQTLRYTDDTQMAVGLAETLIRHGTIREAELMATFAAHYDVNRRYGFGARRLLQAHRDGEDWQALAEHHFPGGSFGNGAAMRAAPVGLFFCHDLDAVADQAAASARPTHRHPLGIDGARLIALSAAMAATMHPFDRSGFFGELTRRSQTVEFRNQLEQAVSLDPDDPSPPPFGNGIEAHRSVVSSLVVFAAAPDDFPKVLARALSLGGDVDTLAAMACALCGARVGLDRIPMHLVALLEDGPEGRDFLLKLAGRLHAARGSQSASNRD